MPTLDEINKNREEQLAKANIAAGEQVPNIPEGETVKLFDPVTNEWGAVHGEVAKAHNVSIGKEKS